MSTRQGSASFTIVLAGLTFVIVGALALTVFFYPIVTALMDSAFWSAETSSGAKLLTWVEGIWKFIGGIMLIALTAWVWIKTRQ